MYFVRPIFVLLLFSICLLDVALTFVLPHQIAYAELWPLAQGCLILALGWVSLLGIARQVRARWPRGAAVIGGLGALCEGVVLVIVMNAGMRILDYLSKGTSLPLADDWLARADGALGFDWLAYFDFVRSHPALHRPMVVAYFELNTAIAILILGLAVTGQHRRVRAFAEAAILCLALGLVGGALFPAIGAAAHWIPDHADPQRHAGFAQMPGVVFVEPILALRQLDRPMLVGTAKLMGLVSMPSVHTALGVLMIGVARRTWLFWPTLAYGAVMVAATPIWGGHYLFDLIAGATMAVGALALIEKGAPSLASRRAGPSASLQQAAPGRRRGLRPRPRSL